jgi:hypothetical protein
MRSQDWETDCGANGGRSILFHYTDTKGFNAIRSQPTWLFKAFQPPCDHPKGAYFTNLPPGSINLGKRIFVRGCRDKLEFVFHFSGGDDLRPLPGGRGEVVFYSTKDYPVEHERQIVHGATKQLEEEFS